MRHIPYKAWCKYVENLYLKHQHRDPVSHLDLGTGTGQLLAHSKARRRVGLDLSEEMLSIAESRSRDIQWILADWNRWESEDLFDLVTSTNTGLNYISTRTELEEHFQKTRTYLSQGGIYFFDITSETNLMENFDGVNIKETHGDYKLEWINEYDPKNRILISKLSFHHRLHGKIGLEEHKLWYYTPEMILSILEKSGFEVLEIGGDYSSKSPQDPDLITFCIKNKNRQRIK
jgi:SAM-dependent methyltransferase